MIFIFTLVVLLLSLIWSLKKRSKPSLPSCHIHKWSFGVSLSVCSHCAGAVQDGYICLICGRIAHYEHCQFLHDCKKESCAEDEIRLHDWIPGNLPLLVPCLVCGEVTGQEPGLSDLRCCWCQECIHLHCLPKQTDCRRSKLSNGLLSPSAVKKTTMLAPHITHRKGFSWKVSHSTYQITHHSSIGSILLCIVNPKAGAQTSNLLLQSLYAHLNPLQVWDLSDGEPRAFLNRFSSIMEKCTVLVCGGDGTVGWILELMDRMKLKGELSVIPPVAVLPLGTGNDLARVLGWGGGWNPEDNVLGILRKVLNGKPCWLDRWKVTIEPLGQEYFFTKKEWILNNYLSMGIDASITLDFHQTREKQPSLFKDRWINKGWYALFGGKHMVQTYSSWISSSFGIKSNSNTIQSEEDVLAIMTEDESMEETPPHTPLAGSTASLKDSAHYDLSNYGGLIVLNVPSYAGGGNIHSTTVTEDSVSMDDQLLNVFGVSGPFELAASIVSLTSPTYLGNSDTLEFKVNSKTVAMQIDGEPWEQQGPCLIRISHNKQSKMLKLVQEVD